MAKAAEKTGPGPTGPGEAGTPATADRYWAELDLEQTAARSRGRAELALCLLGGNSIREGKLLDVGTGPGWALEKFSASGFEARGLEVSPACVAMGRARGLHVDELDLEAGELPRGFRVVTALEVLEHLRDPLALLGRMAHALLPGGWILVSLPNEFHLPRRVSLLLGWPALGGHRQFGGHDDPHQHLFTPALAERLFEAAGLRVVDRAWDGLAPPGWKLFRQGSSLLAHLWPSLFALSGLYLLQPGEKKEGD